MNLAIEAIYSKRQYPFGKPSERAQALANQRKMRAKKRAAQKRIEETRKAFALNNLEMK